MLTRRIRLLAFAPVVTVLACQEPPDITPDLNEYETLVNNANASACECFAELGYTTPSECEADLPEVSITGRQCMDDALAGHEEAGKDFLDCANMALQFYVQCLDANVDCDPAAYDTCSSDYMATLSSCPALPADAESAFNACQ